MAVTAAGTPSFTRLLNAAHLPSLPLPCPQTSMSCARLFNGARSFPSPAIKPLAASLLLLSPPTHQASKLQAERVLTPELDSSSSSSSRRSVRAMEKSGKMAAVAAVLVLVLAAAEARNIKTADAEAAKDAVVQPTTFPPFDRFGSASPVFGGLPGAGGSSIPGFSLPGSGSIGSMPMPFLGGFGGGSPGLGGLGGMPGSPAAATTTTTVDEHAKKP